MGLDSDIQESIRQKFLNLSQDLPEEEEGMPTTGQEDLVVEEEPVVTQQEPVIEEEEPQERLTESQLEGDVSYDDVVLPYMTARYGPTYAEDKSKSEVVAQFMNNMRGFGNNTVRTGKELSWLAGASEEEQAIAGAAYSFVDKDMANLYSRSTTLSEKASGTWDYVRGAVLDPVNVVGGILGKAAGGASFRLGYAAARKAAVTAYRREISKGVAQEAAEKTATKVYVQSATEAAVAAGNQVAQRRGTKGVVSNLLSSQGMREIGASTAVDVASGMITDYGYQKGLMKTGAQDDYNELQTFLSGAVSITSGGISALTVGSRGASDLGLASDVVDPGPPTSEGIGKELTASLKKLSKKSKPWDKLVTEGKKLEELDLAAWTELLRGSESVDGWKGLTQIFSERNLVYNADFIDETFENKSDWIADKIINMPQGEKAGFVSAFKDITGITETVDGRDVTVETFAEVLAAKASELGQGLSFIRQVGRVTGKPDITEESLGTYAKELGLMTAVKDRAFLTNIRKEADSAQTNLIRGIVSNLSTTALNVRGWGLATSMNSLSDLTQAAGLIVAGNTRAATHLIAMQRQKTLNLIDNNTTLEAFQDYLRTRPKIAAAMSREISGGVGQKLDIDFDMSFGDQKITQLVDNVQAINLVYAQDTITKSQEFMYQLDKNIRLQYDMSYSDFLKQPDAFTKMNEDIFRKIEMKAVDETERAIFSRSFKDAPMGLDVVAGAIEDIRSVPGLGLLAPFGKFFNNTVSNMSDNLGLTLTFRAYQKVVGDKALEESFDKRTTQELLARTAATWAAIQLMIPSEVQNINDGLGVFETSDDQTGEVVTRQYDFPLSYIKGVARWRARMQLGQDLTDAEAQLLQDTLGLDQLTRQFGDVGQGARELWRAVSGAEDALPVGDIVEDTIIGSSKMLTSGLTRTFEPVNAAVGLALGEKYSNIDRKQGSRLINENLRYVDQIYALMAGEQLAPEKFNAASGTKDVDVGKFVGLRAVKMTATKKAASMAGVPDWTLGGRSKVAEADNEFNRAFHTLFEYHMQTLVRNEKFKNASVDTRKKMFNIVKNEVKSTSVEYITRGLSAAGRPELGLMYQIMSTGKAKVRESMEILTQKQGFPTDIEDYTIEQLNALASLKKNLDDWKLRFGK